MPKAKPLSKEMIVAAMNKTKSNRAAARYLNVSYVHYKRWAKIYEATEEGFDNLFDQHLNPSGKGIPKFLNNSGFVCHGLEVDKEAVIQSKKNQVRTYSSLSEIDSSYPVITSLNVLIVSLGISDLGISIIKNCSPQDRSLLSSKSIS